MQQPTRERILQSLETVLAPLEFVHAMWQGGAAAFDRVDEWSDIDLVLVVEDDQVETALLAVERALGEVAPIEHQLLFPNPHSHTQKFYRLEGSSPFLLIDLSIIPHSNPVKYREREIHGQPYVHFDKRGVSEPLAPDAAAEADARQARLARLRTLVEMFQIFPQKELRRGNPVEALMFYHAFTLRPLVEVLRLRHAPAHHAFHSRYLYYDLPAEIVARLERLFFVPDGQQIEAYQAEANAWFDEVTASLEGES